MSGAESGERGTTYDHEHDGRRSSTLEDGPAPDESRAGVIMSFSLGNSRLLISMSYTHYLIMGATSGIRQGGARWELVRCALAVVGGACERGGETACIS